MNITVLADAYESDSPDPEVEGVASALREGGHKVSLLLIPDDVKVLVTGLSRRRPDLVFHLIHDFGGENGLIATAGVVDAFKIPYTGGGPGELFIRGNKVLAKKLLAYEKIRCPNFAVFSRNDRLETGGNLRLPLIVKPLERDGSIGIGADALVRTVPEMMERVLAIHKEIGDAALAEEYVEGREFYIGVLGNSEPLALEPVEMDFTGLPEGAPHLLDYKAKWEKSSSEYKGTRAIVPQLDEELKARLKKVALEACRALMVRDYGRVDVRLSETGEIYVIEVNANCDLSPGSEYATGAEAAGIRYVDLINRIAEFAVERRRIAPAIETAAKKPKPRRSSKTRRTSAG